MSEALLPPLEHLSAKADEHPVFDDRVLTESVHGEPLRLLNTWRPAHACNSILAYGLADWTAVQRLCTEGRCQLAREVRAVAEHFEPRPQLTEVEVESDPDNPQRLRIQLGGRLRSGSRLMPALLVIEQGNGGLEVHHERFD